MTKIKTDKSGRCTGSRRPQEGKTRQAPPSYPVVGVPVPEMDIRQIMGIEGALRLMKLLLSWIKSPKGKVR